jgi:hypothetical protein
VLDAGKKVVKWGKGYAWNPVAFVDRPKNPEDPEEAAALPILPRQPERAL